MIRIIENDEQIYVLMNFKLTQEFRIDKKGGKIRVILTDKDYIILNNDSVKYIFPRCQTIYSYQGTNKVTMENMLSY